MNVGDAREAYLEAREIASAAFRAVWDRADKRRARAVRAALLSGTQLTREELSSYVTGITEASRVWNEIMTGPTADIDKALAEAKEQQQ